MCTCVHVYMFMYACTLYMYVHVYMYMCISVYVIHVYVHVHIHVCVHVHAYVCVHLCILYIGMYCYREAFYNGDPALPVYEWIKPKQHYSTEDMARIVAANSVSPTQICSKLPYYVQKKFY